MYATMFAVNSMVTFSAVTAMLWSLLVIIIMKFRPLRFIISAVFTTDSRFRITATDGKMVMSCCASALPVLLRQFRNIGYIALNTPAGGWAGVLACERVDNESASWRTGGRTGWRTGERDGGLKDGRAFGLAIGRAFGQLIDGRVQACTRSVQRLWLLNGESVLSQSSPSNLSINVLFVSKVTVFLYSMRK